MSLLDAPILAWSAISPLGRHLRTVAGTSRADATSCGLESHEAELGIPGFSGRVREELPDLPPGFRNWRSRSCQLLAAALAPLESDLARLVTEHGAERIALVLGSSTGGVDATEKAVREHTRTGALPEDYVFENVHGYDALLRYVEATHGLKGPAFAISTACSSSAKALAAAQRLLTLGSADVVVVCGVDALTELTVRGFAGLGILSPNGCHPFAADRKGIAIGEGAGVLLLGRSERAEFFLRSVGESNDAYHATSPHPEGRGARLAITRALSLAEAREVVYVNAHGTGTIPNDAMESRALFEELGPNLTFSSTKDRTGHLLGAAGTIEAVLCLEAMRRGVYPSTLETTELDTSLPLLPLTSPLERTATPSELVLSNSFAFGGNNVCVAFGRQRRKSRIEAGTKRVFLTGAALFAPGFSNLEDFLAERTTPNLDVAPAESLPLRTRGRASHLTRLFCELATQLASERPALEVPLFTGSSYGEMAITLELLAQIGVDPTLSPAKFQASVHNAASGLITQLEANHSFATAIAAGRDTLGMTLLDALHYVRVHGGEARVLVADADAPRLLMGESTYVDFGLGLQLVASDSVPPGNLGELLTIERNTTEETRPELDASPNLHAHGAKFLRDWLVDSATKRGERRRFRIGPQTLLELG